MKKIKWYKIQRGKPTRSAKVNPKLQTTKSFKLTENNVIADAKKQSTNDKNHS